MRDNKKDGDRGKRETEKMKTEIETERRDESEEDRVDKRREKKRRDKYETYLLSLLLVREGILRSPYIASSRLEGIKRINL